MQVTIDRQGAQASGTMLAMPSPRAPLSAALSRVGDRWSLLVIDALMEAPLRFTALSEAVEGIAPNILSERLRRLEGAGVVIAEPYSRRPLRYEYRLTDDGEELGGVLRLLAAWGSGAEAGEPGLHHEACGSTLEARWHCPTCATIVDEREASELRRL